MNEPRDYVAVLYLEVVDTSGTPTTAQWIDLSSRDHEARALIEKSQRQQWLGGVGCGLFIVLALHIAFWSVHWLGGW